MRDYKKLSLTLAILSSCLSASAQAVNDSVYDEKQLQGVTVTAVKRKGSTNAAVLEMKKSANVVSTISAQEISLTQDNNAGEVIRRVPGVSIIDGKFVMVRGLSQRYNNVWMNGGAVPSSEADARAFSFDMIPGGQIDNLTIVKSPAAEYPADYTGGFVLITTKEIPTENASHFSVGGNWNSQSAFHDFYEGKTSGTDFLGFDNGLRSLHGGITSALNSLGQNSGGNTMYSLTDNHLNNNWLINRHHPLGDLKFAADWNRGWNINGNRLGLLASVNYTNEYRTYLGMINNLYGAYDEAKDKSNPLRVSVDNQYNHNVRLGAMLNLTFLSRDGISKYQLKNVFNQLATDRYTWREGLSAQSEPEHSAELYYQSRTTYTGQLTGKHTFSGDALDWSVGYAYANRRLPDRRKYILYNEDPTSDAGNFVWLYQNDISREWTSLDEHIASLAVNDVHEFRFGDWQPKLKFGAYGEYRYRKYNTRNFFYWYNTEGNTLPAGFKSMNLPTLLSDAQNFGTDKLYLLEDVNKTNDYSGDNLLGAGYFVATLPFGRLAVNAGLRYEYNRMKLVTNARQYEESHQNTYYRHSNLFPSLNMTYMLTDEHQLRFCYGRSINRPEFRELSPSVYYDFDLVANVQGNYELKDCHVDNLDLRWEWYPSSGENISLAAFYKHFQNPIEWVYTMAGGTDVVYSYANAKTADSYGLELDIRKRLDFIGLRYFSLSFNGSLIHSRVHFDKGSNEIDRAMQGQSPYLVNTGLFYNNPHLALNVALLYNRIGKRIISVGRSEGMERNVRVPDSYEMPRDAFDLSVTKTFFNRLELKFAIHDLLNQNVTYKQFAKATVNGQSKEVHQVTRQYKPGRNIAFMVTYKL
jgi:TonB-dependent receptor